MANASPSFSLAYGPNVIGSAEPFWLNAQKPDRYNSNGTTITVNQYTDANTDAGSSNLELQVMNGKGQLVDSRPIAVNYPVGNTGDGFDYRQIASNEYLIVWGQAIDGSTDQTTGTVYDEIVDNNGNIIQGPTAIISNIANLDDVRANARATIGQYYEISYSTFDQNSGHETNNYVDYSISGSKISQGYFYNGTPADGTYHQYQLGTLSSASSSNPQFILYSTSDAKDSTNGYEQYQVYDTSINPIGSKVIVIPTYPPQNASNFKIDDQLTQSLNTTASDPYNLLTVYSEEYSLNGQTSYRLDLHLMNTTTGADKVVEVPVGNKTRIGILADLNDGGFDLSYTDGSSQFIQAFDSDGNALGNAYTIPNVSAKFTLTAETDGHILVTYKANNSNSQEIMSEVLYESIVTAPTITVTTPSRSTTSEAPVNPFSGVAIGDTNSGATDSLTITLSGGGGTLADGAGFGGLTATGTAGSYMLASQTAADVTAELNALVFTPSAGTPGSPATTTFTLNDQSSAATNVATATTTVTDTASTAAPTAPTITVTTPSHSTTSEAPVNPFSGVSIGDTNSGATDSLTITLSGGGGTLADGAGFGGLTATGTAGSYILASQTAADVTAELDALVFTPSAGTPGSPATTTFTLNDQSSAGTNVTDASTSVTDTAAAAALLVTFDPTTAGFTNGETPVLTGTVSAGATSVELFGNGQDLGAATLGGNDTWTFKSHIGAGDFADITAVASDATGDSSSASAPYELVTGITGEPYRAVEYDYTSDGSYAYTEFSRHGGDLASAADNGDGTHTMEAYANGQVLSSIHDDVMTADGVSERFVFNPHFGKDEITDFKVGGARHDVIDLSNTPFSSLAEVIRHTTMSYGSATIHLNSQDSITLDGVTKAQLKAHPNDFALA